MGCYLFYFDVGRNYKILVYTMVNNFIQSFSLFHVTLSSENLSMNLNEKVLSNVWLLYKINSALYLHKNWDYLQMKQYDQNWQDLGDECIFICCKCMFKSTSKLLFFLIVIIGVVIICLRLFCVPVFNLHCPRMFEATIIYITQLFWNDMWYRIFIFWWRRDGF